MPSVSDNPFRVHSPEALSADQVVSLYVSEMPGTESVLADGHTMIVGSRGSGKSMMLRFLEPDCQRLAKSADGQNSANDFEIDFFSLYVTIKQTDLMYPELQRLTGTHADRALNEHFLIVVILLKALARCLKNNTLDYLEKSDSEFHKSDFVKFVESHFDISTAEKHSPIACIRNVCGNLSRYFEESLAFLDLILDDPNSLPKYSEKLLRFSTFLLPFLDSFRRLKGMPASGRLFVIVDDADWLNETQTRVLNSYISQRLERIYFKVSTETYQYKTYYTLGERRIEIPHDFTEINTVDIYTSNNSKHYKERIAKIINKRLALFTKLPSSSGSMANAEAFFPEDPKQFDGIGKISAEISAKPIKGLNRSIRVRDDVYRYSRPEYIRRLGGDRKSRSTYSYSGFNQLVNISSGVPRYFLDAAHAMFDRVRVTGKEAVLKIPPSIQDAIIREQADRIVMDELERLKLDDVKNDGSTETAVRLHNLVVCIGALFEKALVSEGISERRVFSFAISDTLEEDVSIVLNFGVRLSVFTRTSIGRKEGFGRTHRYILTRRIAPYFNLDPNGFSAYKFLKNSTLKKMMTEPDMFRRELRTTNVDADSIGPLFELDREK